MAVSIPDFEPPYDETEDTVRARMDTDADADLDKRELGYYQLNTEPAVKEMARIYDSLNDVLQMSSPLFAFGIYLDYKAAERGLTRTAATKSEGSVTVTGTNGVVIPSGTRFSAPGESGDDESVRFISTDEVTISGGTATVDLEAEDAGVAGNVGIAAVTVLEDVINGVSAVTNAAAFTGGTDEEDDDSLRERLMLEINAPQAAGSASDLERWALSRSGVVQAAVIPTYDGAYTAKVVVMGEDNAPVSQSVLDDVQRYLSGDAVLTDPTVALTDAVGAAGAITGTLYYKYTFVDDEGAETKPSPVSDGVTLTAQRAALSGIAVGPTGTVARRVYRSATSGGTFELVTEIADNTTTTYDDNDASVAGEPTAPRTNNTSAYTGQVPIGMRVAVDTPTQVAIDIAATITYESGYSLDGSGGTIALEDSLDAALDEYLNDLPPGGDVIYNNIIAVLFSVDGVYDVSSVTVEAGTSNVAVSSSQVATLGTTTYS